MKVITGYWHIKPAFENEFLALCKWIAPYAKAEEGYVSYLFAKDEANENYFLFFEEWKNQEAIEFHVEQWYFKEFMQKANSLLVSKPVIKIYDVEKISVL